MAFTRNFLKSIGLNDEQISSVMEEHTNVTDALKAQRDGYKADAEKLPGVQQELDSLKGNEDFKQKYDDEHAAFETFKKQVAQDAETAKVKAAYRKLLTDEKISEKRLDAVIKLTDFSGMKLDKDGNLVDVDKLKENINTEWGDFKVTQRERGPEVEKPPVDNNGGASNEIRQLTQKWHEARYGKPQTN